MTPRRRRNIDRLKRVGEIIRQVIAWVAAAAIGYFLYQVIAAVIAAKRSGKSVEDNDVYVLGGLIIAFIIIGFPSRVKYIIDIIRNRRNTP